MAILRNRYYSDSICIPRSIFSDNSIATRERGLLCHLLTLPDDSSFTLERLVEMTGNGRGYILTGLNNLKAAGYLKHIETHLDTGIFEGCIFEIDLKD